MTYFSSPNKECYNTEQLKALQPTELQEYAIDLHYLACQAQEQLGPQSCTSEGFCYETILRVKIPKEVVQILIEKTHRWTRRPSVTIGIRNTETNLL